MYSKVLAAAVVSVAVLVIVHAQTTPSQYLGIDLIYLGCCYNAVKPYWVF